MKKNTTYRWMLFFIVLTTLFTLLPTPVLAETTTASPYPSSIPLDPPVIKRHLRGTWISTVVNLDWPSSETSKIQNDTERIQKSKDELVAILDKASEMNLNAVFFQVSPEGDAFYSSRIVPWSRYLTGTFGKDPGFDPLAFAVEEAHKRNLEFHAWFNPYRVSMYTNDTTIASLNTPGSVFSEHPEWIRTAMNRFVVDPGIPEAREWVMERVMEVVDHYDVDGIHFDDYFYYEKYESELNDQDTYQQYNQGQFSTLGDWRRNNTYLLIQELSGRVRTAKPWIKFGVSPAGVWGNQRDGHPDGSDTNSSLTNYDRAFADTKRWVEEELLDYIAPQVYFSFANPRASYSKVVNWWSDVCRGKNTHLYIGQALYKINDADDRYFKGDDALTEFSNQLKFNMVTSGVSGSILFRAKNFNDLRKQPVVQAMKEDLWSSPALVPVMSWKGSGAPAAPTAGKASILSNGVHLSWNDTDPTTAYFAIYRFPPGETLDITSDASATNLVRTIRKGQNGIQEFIDTQTNASGNVYLITALDRLHNESIGLLLRPSQSAYFWDVGQKYTWAAEAIDHLFEKEILLGDGKGRFYPEANTKRGDFVLMIVRAFGLTADVDSKSFDDVPKDSYYADAIGTARALGIIKGRGSYFGPTGSITRQDMMVLLARAMDTSGIHLEDASTQSLNQYKDANAINSYARSAVARLTKAGLIQGSSGKVNPHGLATRAEIATIFYRILYRESSS